jgi:hypothetical protein
MPKKPAVSHPVNRARRDSPCLGRLRKTMAATDAVLSVNKSGGYYPPSFIHFKDTEPAQDAVPPVGHRAEHFGGDAKRNTD